MITRRQVMAGIACCAPSVAQGKRVISTDKVFLDYTQAALDAAYDQAVWAPNMQQVTARWASNSDLVRGSIGDPVRRAYGETGIERLDIYRGTGANRPVHIAIHGGSWQGGSARNFAFAAETFVRAGAVFVVPDFVDVQDAGKSLLAMDAQVRRAIAWVYRNAASFGGDPNRIYLSGHSSGAHLAACALTAAEPLPIRGAVLISGVYDLEGPSISARRTLVNFDQVTLDTLSPQRHIDRVKAPIMVAYGTLESPEFQRQAREFATTVRTAGKPAELLVLENYNHFETVETLANPYSPLGRAALAQMNLP